LSILTNLNCFLVWEPTSARTRVPHGTRREAELEAERLARVNPTKTFYVLHAVSRSRAETVHTQRVEEIR
jgi:hypothetical protein